MTTSKKCSALFHRNVEALLRHFPTVDETWIHQNTPETKQMSKHWVSMGKSPPKKTKVVFPASKVMATILLGRLTKKKVLFHQDNGNEHRCAVAIAKSNVLGYKMLFHPPFSPDLTPVTISCFQTWRDGSAKRKVSKLNKNSWTLNGWNLLSIKCPLWRYRQIFLIGGGQIKLGKVYIWCSKDIKTGFQVIYFYSCWEVSA